MIENDKQIIKIEIPLAEAADMATRAAAMGVSLAYYGGILALQGAYGFMHPDVIAHRTRPSAGVCGPEMGEGK